MSASDPTILNGFGGAATALPTEGGCPGNGSGTSPAHSCAAGAAHYANTGIGAIPPVASTTPAAWIDDICTFARRKFAEHGIEERGWLFGFKSLRACAGVCDFSLRTIYLSRQYICDPTVPLVAIQNTILHEIAHVLAGWQAGHNKEWVRIAKSIGCDGARLNEHWEGVPPKYRVVCACGHVSFRRHRVSKVYHSRVCSKCKGGLKVVLAK